MEGQFGNFLLYLEESVKDLYFDTLDIFFFPIMLTARQVALDGIEKFEN